MSKWDELTLQEKADMIDIAVRNGIVNLKDIQSKYNEFAEGGETEVVIAPDSEYNQYLNTLPDNQRFTPNDKYDSYLYWKLNGKPKNFQEAIVKGMFNYDRSDNSYHANSIAFGDDGIGYFMKPKDHDTVGYELDWFNKGLITEEGGYQRQMTPEERFEWLNFRRNYQLLNDPNRPNYYRYVPKKFAGGGFTDDDLVDWIIREEGFNSKPENIGDGKITLGSGLTNPKWHKLYRQRGNRWSAADNRAAVAEEVANRRRWAEKNIPNWDTLPTSSQKALLSYKYNYDFNQANSPKLFKALADSNLVEAARQIDATSKDPKFIKGLTDRRTREQQWFLSDVSPKTTIIPIPTYPEPAVSTAIYNPYIQQSQNQPIPTKMIPNGYVEAHRLTPSEERKNNLLKSWETIQNFNRMMELTGIQNNPLQEFVPLFNVGNIEADGGGIHIKPSHRGRLTELKARTGKSEAELYNDGNPAHKKMVVFARNARKWHH